MIIHFVLDGGYVEYITFFFYLSLVVTRNSPTAVTEVTATTKDNLAVAGNLCPGQVSKSAIPQILKCTDYNFSHSYPPNTIQSA